MKRFGFLVVLIIIGLAFLGGYWPQHRQLEQAQNKIQQTKEELSQAQSTIGLCRLQSQLVTLIQETGSKNFADAAALSTKFFNGLRRVVDNTPPSDLKSSLQSVLNQRDAVTAAIARGDPKAHDLLVQLLDTMSQSISGKNSKSQPQH